jgi:hypothetical protein
MKSFFILFTVCGLATKSFSQVPNYVDENYTLIQNQNSWGIWDNSTNKWIVNPIKMKIEAQNYSYFSDGLCPVEVNQKGAYINGKGNIEIQTDFEKVYSF